MIADVFTAFLFLVVLVRIISLLDDILAVCWKILYYIEKGGFTKNER